jgi:hypothetical protein
MFQNTGIRTQRNRLRKLNNQTPSAMNWLNISTVVDEEGSTGFIRATGFTGSTTLRVSVPQDVALAGDGSIFVIVSPSADPTVVKYDGAIQVSSSTNSVTSVPVSPGDYVAFYVTCASPTGPITVTVQNMTSSTTIDTFQVQVEV